MSWKIGCLILQLVWETLLMRFLKVGLGDTLPVSWCEVERHQLPIMQKRVEQRVDVILYTN